jgi:prepilin-type N-terminal cleavage/methylation domain-containing protein
MLSAKLSTTTLRTLQCDERGFTLAELLVTTAIVGLIMMGLFSSLSISTEAYLTGANQVETQESARIALARVSREIRGAGYNPTGANFNAVIGAGGAGNPDVTGLTIQSDLNGNGTVNGAGDAGEQISYTLNGTTLNRQVLGVDLQPQPVIGGVQALTLSYWDASGNQLAAPVPVAQQANIKSIQIQLTTQPESQPSTWTTGAVQTVMTARVRLRNRRGGQR